MTRLQSSMNATERRLLAILFSREADGMLPPTVRELTTLLGLGKNSVHWTETVLQSLRRKGFVTWEVGAARTLRLTCRLVDASPSAPR